MPLHSFVASEGQMRKCRKAWSMSRVSMAPDQALSFLLYFVFDKDHTACSTIQQVFYTYSFVQGPFES